MPGSEAAEAGAAVLAGGSGGDGASGRLAKEAGSAEAAAAGSHSSAGVTPPKSSAADVAAPSPKSAAAKEKVEGGSAPERGERARRTVEGHSGGPGAAQLPDSRPGSQSSGSGEKLASTGGRAKASPGLSPGTGAPQSKPTAASAERPSPDAKSPPAVKSSQAGKGKDDATQTVTSSPSKVSV